MYVSLSNIITAPFSSEPKEVKSGDDGDHTYIRGSIECRGPCPGLNALANQGYLPRDGKNISIAQVDHTLKTALHMDSLASRSLTNALKPLLHKDDKTFDLIDLRRHNVVEHDASFTRLDFHQGDNYTFQPALFEAMLQDAAPAPAGPSANGQAQAGPPVPVEVTLHSIARTWNRRSKESRAAGAPRLPLKLWVVAALQAVSVANVAQTKLTREVLEAIYIEERFPDVVLENKKTRTLWGLLSKGVVMVFYSLFSP